MNIKNIEALNIPRIEDLPYASSPPIQFVYESIANLNQGVYIWDDTQSNLTPERPLIDNALYYFRSITLSADISSEDFSANIVTTPKFFTYLEGTAKTVLFREPILMPVFLNQMEYKLTWFPNRGSDNLLAGFQGSLVQGANLVGKTSITLKAIITAQEIVEDNFINLFVSKYPANPKNIREAKYE